MPVDGQALVIAVIGPACPHDLSRVLLARRPEVRPHLTGQPTESPGVLVPTEQADVGLVVEHEEVWSQLIWTAHSAVKAKIHQ